MLNHLIGLEKHMFFAALLGQTWDPSQKEDFRYDKVLDFENKVRSPWATPRASPDIAASAKKHPAPIEGEELRPWRAP
jgi:hypothetical protein